MKTVLSIVVALLFTTSMAFAGEGSHGNGKCGSSDKKVEKVKEKHEKGEKNHDYSMSKEKSHGEQGEMMKSEKASGSHGNEKCGK